MGKMGRLRRFPVPWQCWLWRVAARRTGGGGSATAAEHRLRRMARAAMAEPQGLVLALTAAVMAVLPVALLAAVAAAIQRRGAAVAAVAAVADWAGNRALVHSGGGALGGWAGSQIGGGTGKLAATAAGTLLGALIGNGVGSSLDKSDETYAWMEVQRSLSSNQPLVWRGHESAGVVTPMRTLPEEEKRRDLPGVPPQGLRRGPGAGRRRSGLFQRDGSWRLANG